MSNLHHDRAGYSWAVKATALTALLLITAFPARVRAQSAAACPSDRAISTLVGAGLGATAVAIPATILHRHDQTSSHRLVAGGVAVGAVFGLLAVNRDQACVQRADSSRANGTAPITRRSTHGAHGAVVGALIGGVLGAVGGTFYQTGCTRAPCNARTQQVGIILFSAGEGAAAGGLLGGLLGWAWPIGK